MRLGAFAAFAAFAAFEMSGTFGCVWVRMGAFEMSGAFAAFEMLSAFEMSPQGHVFNANLVDIPYR